MRWRWTLGGFGATAVAAATTGGARAPARLHAEQGGLRGGVECARHAAGPAS